MNACLENLGLSASRSIPSVPAFMPYPRSIDAKCYYDQKYQADRNIEKGERLINYLIAGRLRQIRRFI